MRLDITQVVSALNKYPTSLRFSYLKDGARQNLNLSLATAPDGYITVCNENDTYNFGTAVVDVAYGKPGGYAYKTGLTGIVTFNNAFFGDPLVGTFKSGYCKGFFPFEVRRLVDPVAGKICIAVSPQRTAKCLAALTADSTAVNHSLVVNVDYSSIGPTYPLQPSLTIPRAESDYGVILQECTDLTSFTRGFSLVTNLRTYIADDFNIVEYDVATVPKPAGYTPASGQYLPPCSLFAPEKRYGAGLEIYGVKFGGPAGSLAGDAIDTPIRPLDSKKMTGFSFDADKITANLRAINHPAALPPINMMNWLVILEERRKEFVGY